MTRWVHGTHPTTLEQETAGPTSMLSQDRRIQSHALPVAVEAFAFRVLDYHRHLGHTTYPGRSGGGESLFFFFTLVTGSRRSVSLKLSDKRVYAPQIRARLRTAAHFCEVVVLKLRAQSVCNQLFERSKQVIKGQKHQKTRVPAASGGQVIPIPLGFLGRGALASI